MMQTAPQQQQVTPPPAAPAEPQSLNPKDVLTRLLSIMNELCQVMEEEMPLLEERNYKLQAQYIKRKQDLTVDYQSMMKLLTQNTALLGSLKQDDVKLLKATGGKLDLIAEKNARAIRQAHSASERLLKTIITQVRKDLHHESGYSGSGRMALAEAYRARPISVNQRV